MIRSAFQFLKPVTRLSISLRALSHVPVDDHLFGLSDEERELRYESKFWNLDSGLNSDKLQGPSLNQN